jgi:uridine kinase
MKDDRVFVKEWHRRAARLIVDRIEPFAGDRITLSVAGESGAGKSEIAVAIRERLESLGVAAGILQADDYFIYMSRICDAMRRKALELVGPTEVKLDFIDCHLRSFKRGADDLYKPVAVYEEARFEREVMPVADLRVLIAEGTYCMLLEFADRRVFIDRDYHETRRDRRDRARDLEDDYTDAILQREHEIIREHKALADFVVGENGDVEVQETRRTSSQ